MTQWVVLQVFTGSERKIADKLDNLLSLFYSPAEIKDNPSLAKMKDLVFEVFVPNKLVSNCKSKKVRYESVIPSYLFIKCTLTDSLWHVLRNVPGVLAIFCRTGVTDKEMDRLKRNCMSEAELAVLDENIRKAIMAKYKEAMEVVRRRRTVLRLPLELVRKIMNEVQILTKKIHNLGVYSSNKLIRLLLEPVSLVV